MPFQEGDSSLDARDALSALSQPVIVGPAGARVGGSTHGLFLRVSTDLVKCLGVQKSV